MTTEPGEAARYVAIITDGNGRWAKARELPVGEDEERRAEAELQKHTNARIAELDGLLKGKEEEILEV